MDVYTRLLQAFQVVILDWGTPFTAENVAQCNIPPTAIEQYKVNLRTKYPGLEILFNQVIPHQIYDHCEKIRGSAELLNRMLIQLGYEPIAIPPEMARQRPGQPIPQPVQPLPQPKNFPGFKTTGNVLQTLVIPETLDQLPAAPQPVQPVPQPIQPIPQNDDYQPIATPRPEDFMFQATPENAAFIQASMVTGREIYPPFSMYLEWAIVNKDYILQNTVAYRQRYPLPNEERLFRRSTYPRYLRDASTYEVFYIYNVPEARNLIQLLDHADLDDYEIRDEDDYHREHWAERDPDTYQRSFFAHMHNQGYRYDYFKYVKHLPITNPVNPLTPDRLRASLTPDQQILVEAWRQRALTPITTPLVDDPSHNNNNMRVLGLRNIRDQILTGISSQALVIPDIGYSNDAMKRTIREVNSHLRGVYDTKGLTRQFIMYEGESALASAGRRYHKYRFPAQVVNGRKVYRFTDEIKTTRLNKNLTNTRLPMWGTKSYYTMLYLELAARGLINEQGQVTI